VNKLFTFAIMLDALILVYIQLVIMLTVTESAKSGTKVFV